MAALSLKKTNIIVLHQLFAVGDNLISNYFIGENRLENS